MTKKSAHIDTKLQHMGLSPDDNFGIPNPPIYRTSTILSSSMAQHRGDVPKPYDYGRIGTPTTDAFEGSIAQLYGADDCISTPSGLSAISTALLSISKAGCHALFPDSVYGSARRFVTQTLSSLGVDTEFYPPRLDKGIEELIRPETAYIYLESPGSLTFELQDISSITSIARQHDVMTVIDNTWGTALHLDVFSHGIDIVIEAGTKYIAGHSDTNLGIVASCGEIAAQIRRTARNLGVCAGPEDLYLGLRGLRTLRLRLEQSAQNGIAVAESLAQHPAVIDMLHPGLESSPDQAVYRKHFTGSCGLFGLIIQGDISQDRIDSAIEGMAVFRIGDSWGGYESLIKQAHLGTRERRFTPEHKEGHLLRFYCGLEHHEDLIADASSMLDRLLD